MASAGTRGEAHAACPRCSTAQVAADHNQAAVAAVLDHNLAVAEEVAAARSQDRIARKLLKIRLKARRPPKLGISI